MAKEVRARSSLASKKTRLRPEPLHAPRAARQHAHPAPPKAHCLHANSRPCRQGAGDCGSSPGPPPPSCCMTSACAFQGQDWNVCHLGFGGQGSHKRGLLILALPGGTHRMGKLGDRGALGTPPGWLARSRGGRQETKMAGGSLVYHHCRDLRSLRGRVGVVQLPHAHGGVYPVPLGMLPELLPTENTDVEALSPWWVFLGLTGPGASIGESRFHFCYLLLLSITWCGSWMPHSAWKHVTSFSSALGGSQSTHHDLGSQVDWTHLPGLCFMLDIVRRMG